MARRALADYPAAGPYRMTSMRLPRWLLTAIAVPAHRAAVEPWVWLAHLLIDGGHVTRPSVAMPLALRVRYGGDLASDGRLVRDRAVLAYLGLTPGKRKRAVGDAGSREVARGHLTVIDGHGYDLVPLRKSKKTKKRVSRRRLTAAGRAALARASHARE